MLERLLVTSDGSDAARLRDETARLGDLQAVSEADLARAKSLMSEGYEKHRLRPGDPGYVYDRRVDFQEPAHDNDWDDDLEDLGDL